MKKFFITFALLFIYLCAFSQTLEKEVLLIICIDGSDKLHIKSGKMYWEHLFAAPPGLHKNCLTKTTVNNNKWLDWKSTFDLGFSTDSLLKSTIIKKVGSSKLIQSPSKKNNWETIWYFDDPGPGPNNYIVSFVYLQKADSHIPNNISFETGNANLTSQSKIELDSISKFLQQTDKVIEISGHTDNSGNKDNNLQLSQERAKAVYDYLQSKGIPAAKMRYEGFGDTKPILPNDNEKNKAINRRVEIKILGSQNNDR